jgi:hypothetical protein
MQWALWDLTAMAGLQPTPALAFAEGVYELWTILIDSNEAMS